MADHKPKTIEPKDRIETGSTSTSAELADHKPEAAVAAAAGPRSYPVSGMGSLHAGSGSPTGGAAPPAGTVTVIDLAPAPAEFILGPKAAAGEAGLQRFADGGSSIVHQLKTLSGIEIEVIDRIRPANAAMFAGGSSGAPGSALLLRMDREKGLILQQQSLDASSPLWLTENKTFERLRQPASPIFSSSPFNALFDAGSTVQVDIQVVGENDAPLSEATVTIYGLGLQGISQFTDANGVASFRLPAASIADVPAILIDARSMHWNRVVRNAALRTGAVNRARLTAFGERDRTFKSKGAISWGVERLGLLRNAAEVTGRGVKVGVIDSGCDSSHPFLSRVVKGRDFGPSAQHDSWKNDEDGHGTHVAGIIGASSGDIHGWSVRGVAPEVEFYIYKVFPDGKYFTIAKAIEQAIADGVDILNMSLGSPGSDPFMAERMQAAAQAGIACIVATGNSGDDVKFPAFLDAAIAVSAVGSIQAIPPDSAHFTQVVKEFASPDGLFSPAFTCFGTSVDFAAPGVGVISTVPKNGFKAMDGTSMAAPHVTGLAALLLAHDPMLINSRRDRSRVDLLVQRLRGTAKALAFGAARSGAGLPVYAPAAAYVTPGVVSALGSTALGLGHADVGMHPCRCKH